MEKKAGISGFLKGRCDTSSHSQVDRIKDIFPKIYLSNN